MKKFYKCNICGGALYKNENYESIGEFRCNNCQNILSTRMMTLLQIEELKKEDCYRFSEGERCYDNYPINTIRTKCDYTYCAYINSRKIKNEKEFYAYIDFSNKISMIISKEDFELGKFNKNIKIIRVYYARLRMFFNCLVINYIKKPKTFLSHIGFAYSAYINEASPIRVKRELL